MTDAAVPPNGPAEAITGPLSDIRVLDIATFIAAPFCGTLLADFGADVLKIEQPEGGDTLRRFGTLVPGADTLVWASEARNKRSMTLDLRRDEGREIFLSLVSRSHVVLENFRPGTLEKWGLGFEEIRAVNPRIVMLRVSGYGQTGPMRGKPGFARIAHAFGGLSHLAGEADGRPVVPGSTSLADYMTGLFGAVGVLVALRHAERSGEGQEIDIALYESVFRVLDEIAPAYARSGFERSRLGPDTVNAAPHSHYRTQDGEWVAIACTTDRMWINLARAIGPESLTSDARFATGQLRDGLRTELNAIVGRWTEARTVAQVLDACAQHDVPASKLMSIGDIFADPQFAARGNLRTIADERFGELTLPGPLPSLSRTPAQLRSVGPALGESTDHILSDLLGHTAAEIVRLRTNGII
ncbi:MAG: CaiB/BaiF CoA-transferase family protein [Sphingomonadales bacterium]